MNKTQLGVGTQTILLKDAYGAVCDCRRALTWTLAKDGDITATTECECSMVFTAMLATIKIEGINRNDN